VADPRFTPFGVPLVEPEQLTLEERLHLLRGDLESWKFGRCNAYVGRWVAASIGQFLEHGGDLARLLGLRPPRGSTATAGRIERRRERDVLLVRLTVAVGTAARAQRVLAGTEACPARARPLLEALKAHRVPTSRSALSRAKKVASHRG
jgi:hypothetical protein